MRRQAEAVGAVDELKQLAFEDWWIIWSVIRVPQVGEDNELHTDEARPAVLELINQSLWLRRVQDVVRDQCGVDEMHAHCALIGATDAAQDRTVPWRCITNVAELLGSSTDGFDERGRRSGAVACVLRCVNIQ